MTSQEMMKTQCKPGYWFVNKANLGEDPDWRMEVAPHESRLLFGYEEDELLKKQYR